VLLPLLGAIINGVWGKRIGRQGVYIAAISAVGMSFAPLDPGLRALLKAGARARRRGPRARRGPTTTTTSALSYRAWDWFIAPLGPDRGRR
jgi:hypothetical protein